MKFIEGWETVTVGPLIDLINGFAFPSDRFTEDEGIPLIRIRDLDHQETEINFRGRYDNRYIVKRGDLLIGMDGDFLTVKWKGSNALLNQRVCKLVSKDAKQLVQDFLFYRIIDEIVRINRITSATTVKHLSSRDVLGIKIDLPPIPEQTKIAEVLSTVDRAIEQTEELIAKQQCIKTGLMQDLLTRGIDENGNLRSEETHQFQDSPLGQIPVKWEVKQIEGSNIKLIDGDRGDNYPKQEDLLADGYCLFLSAKNVTRAGFCFDECQFISKSRDKKLSSGRLEVGDIVLTTRGTVGNFGLVDSVLPYENMRINSGMIIFRNCESELLSEYLYESYRTYIFQIEYQRTVSGSAQPQLPARDIKLFHFFKPKLDEQHKIVNIAASIEAMLNKENEILSKLRSLKTALMQDLLTGKVRVTPLLTESQEKGS